MNLSAGMALHRILDRRHDRRRVVLHIVDNENWSMDDLMRLAEKGAASPDDDSLEPRLRLLRAYFFRGGFCGTGGRAQVAIFDDAKAVAEETVHLLDEQTGRSKARVGARSPAEAAAVYLWAAVSWAGTHRSPAPLPPRRSTSAPARLASCRRRWRPCERWPSCSRLPTR